MKPQACAAFYRRTCCAFRRHILSLLLFFCMCVCVCSLCNTHPLKELRLSKDLTEGDRHVICVSCLGEDHAALALADGGCPHCKLLPMVTLRTRLAFFSEPALPVALPSQNPLQPDQARRFARLLHRLPLNHFLMLSARCLPPPH